MPVSERRSSEPGPILVDHFDLDRIAVLLDFDGTLVEIAATPEAVRVPPTLKHTLSKLRDRLGGALCLVSGRPLADLDVFFAPLRVAIIGGHGAENRPTPNGEVVEVPTGLDPALKRQLLAVASATPGLRAEEKRHSLALHYRLVPEQERWVAQEIARICAQWPAESIEILPGKAVFEVKPRAFNKGVGVRALMAQAPFKGRRPIFVGDDVTDESAIAVLPEYDGRGYSVGRSLAGTHGYFATPREVRHWLYGLLQARDPAEGMR